MMLFDSSIVYIAGEMIRMYHVRHRYQSNSKPQIQSSKVLLNTYYMRFLISRKKMMQNKVVLPKHIQIQDLGTRNKTLAAPILQCPNHCHGLR